MRDVLYPLRVLHGRLHTYKQETQSLSVIQKRIRATERNTVLFVLTPTHGNLGDHAIASAVSKMLREVNIPYIEITADELKLMQKHHKMRLMNGRTILVNGGGNIGTLWMSVERIFRSIIQGCPDSRILCLPNTAFFEDSEQGRYEYVQSERIYRAHSDLTICAREKISFQLLKKIHGNVLLIPDMALSLNESRTDTKRSGCLLCLRTDREKTRDEETDCTILEQASRIFQSNIFHSDMNIGRPVSAENREKELSEKYDIFRSAELVITDRLHGMIFAAITGTPCIVIDSKSPKVRGCYDWIRDLGYVRFVENANEIAETYHRLKSENNTYTSERLQPYYQELKTCLLGMRNL